MSYVCQRVVVLHGATSDLHCHMHVLLDFCSCILIPLQRVSENLPYIVYGRADGVQEISCLTESESMQTYGHPLPVADSSISFAAARCVRKELGAEACRCRFVARSEIPKSQKPESLEAQQCGRK